MRILNRNSRSWNSYLLQIDYTLVWRYRRKNEMYKPIDEYKMFWKSLNKLWILFWTAILSSRRIFYSEFTEHRFNRVFNCKHRCISLVYAFPVSDIDSVNWVCYAKPDSRIRRGHLQSVIAAFAWNIVRTYYRHYIIISYDNIIS